MRNRIETLRYLRHGQRVPFGWVLADDLQGTSHGCHAVLIRKLPMREIVKMPRIALSALLLVFVLGAYLYLALPAQAPPPSPPAAYIAPATTQGWTAIIWMVDLPIDYDFLRWGLIK